ncbi:MAG: polymer-forming cytoskeletal protein [Burkholderiaceae bacterium]|nr:MAG: polymer-forming cytoskeletal protein [Burkholderiaceae bacterium]
MALQSPFFGNKRESDGFNPRPTPTSGGATGLGGINTVQPVTPAATSLAGNHTGAAPVTTTPAVQESGSKLTVGPNIKLKGVEITDCDTLVVEGLVEATMDSRVMQIAQQGAFKGSAEIDIAEIRGQFDGSLTVRDKLVIFATGKVTGKIRYGKLVIEEGGQLSGEVEFGAGNGAKSAAAKAASLHVATAAA